MLLFMATSSGCPFETFVYLAFQLCTFLFLPGRSVLSFLNCCRSINVGTSNLSEEMFSIFNPIWSFDFPELLLKTQPPTSTSIEFHFHASIRWKSLKISSGEGILIGKAFFKAITCVCFLTIDLFEQNSFKLLITRWFNPPWFSFCNETEITLQVVNWHSKVAEQNLWF